MKRKAKKLFAMVLAVVMLTCAVPMGVFAHGSNGIAGNGTNGIWIDIYAGAYQSFSQIQTWGAYAWGPEGCAWFASARVKELTGRGTMIYSGYSWYYNQYSPYGFSRGSATPTEKALACYANHVSVVEAVNGNTYTISEGGHSSYPNNDYCVIRTTTKAAVESGNGGFYGYVYLGVPFNVNQDPKGDLDSAYGGEGTVTVSGWAFDPDVPNQSIDVHVYIGGWAGQGTGECHHIKADKPRGDVNTAYGISGNHGFQETIKTSKVGTVQVYVYAINNVAGNNPEIWDSGKTVTITKHTHSYTSKVTKAATCSATGIRTYTCSCGDSYTEPIAKNPNNHVNTKNVAATASTCTVKGYTAGVYCNDCKKYISGHQEQPLAAHQTTIINAKEATTTEEGYTGDEYCTVCKQTINKGSIIPKLTGTEQDSPDEQNQQEKTGGCPWCGQTHKGVIIAFLVAMFHVMLAAIFGARY